MADSATIINYAHFPRYELAAADRRWLLYRLVYYFAQLAAFCLIVYRIGPNLVLFGSLFSPSPAYYAGLTPRYAPTVAAAKAYQRDHGSLPFETSGLTKYLPKGTQPEQGNILNTPYVAFQAGGGVLAYDFRPASEGWIMYAPRFHGRIPAPIVPAAPPANAVSASRPSTNAAN